MAMHHAFALSGGAALIAPAQTRFRLWAPDCATVEIEVDGQAPAVMERREEGWFEIDLPVGAGARYRYRVRPDLAVPDPMSRGQAGDIHDFSLVVDPAAYSWKNPGWRGLPWPETVIYELHPGLCGGFNGVAKLLPALRELGVTAVELMPVADFPGSRNWGYDGVLPFAPDRAYGSVEEFKALVDRAHELGLMIFLDVVYNHFGPDGNYLNTYASRFFRPDEHTPWGAAIDFRQPLVRRYFVENALYWLEEYQIDGLRLDAVHAISSQDWLPELSRAVRTQFPDRRIHLMLEHDGNAARLLERDFAAQWNDDIHHALHVLLTGETAGYYGDYALSPIDMLARCLHEGFAYQGEISVHRGGVSRGTPSKHLSPDHFIFFLQNHDQIGNRAFGERLITLTSAENLRIAVALQLLAPQIPLLFMGEEIGSRQPFLYFTSHDETLAAAVRQGRRKEFAQFPQFSAGDTLNKLPDPNAPETYAGCRLPAESANASAWRQFYRDLLAVRRETIVPRLTGSRSLRSRVLSPEAVLAEWLMGDGHILTIAVNFGNAPLSCECPTGAPLFVLNHPTTATGKVQLPPHSFAAWLRAG
ncbi:MAG TPA: malto-oligosyltrehalose trehalohydrolase [Terriglobia bacterium]|nr:malto-oligosyltrehalose trehalohydrolase [Terriglobia bacterium]